MGEQLWHPSAATWLKTNQRTFGRLVHRAISLNESGHFENAALLAEAAAQFAWLNHPGQHASRALEDLCARIGRQRCAEPGSARAATQVKKVLHVVTQCYDIGGHTRAIRRWIELDQGRRHSLAVTSPAGGRLINAALLKSVLASGGQVHEIANESNRILDKATRLRTLAFDADLVILHVHPSDVCPAIAFAAPAGLPPITIQNHADHVFWIGANVLNSVINFRSAGRDLATDRRGIPLVHQSVVPLPLDAERRVVDRTEAKAALGLPRDSFILLTVASAYKFANVSTALDFFATQSKFLARHPRAVHIVVGADQTSLPASASPRLKVVAATPDIAMYYDAADLYVDSFPFASVTSLLEAGQRGTPLVGLEFGDRLTRILRGTDDGTAELVTTPRIGEWQSVLDQLMSDEAGRLAKGGEIASVINADHLNPNWQAAINQAYDLAARSTRIELCAVPTEATEVDLIVTSVNACSSFSKSRASILSGYIRRLSFKSSVGLVLSYPGVASLVGSRLMTRAFQVLGAVDGGR